MNHDQLKTSMVVANVYVLKRNEDGAYVAKPGSRSSYTHDIRRARRFYHSDVIAQHKCGNETAVTVAEELGL